MIPDAVPPRSRATVNRARAQISAGLRERAPIPGFTFRPASSLYEPRTDVLPL